MAKTAYGLAALLMLTAVAGAAAAQIPEDSPLRSEGPQACSLTAALPAEWSEPEKWAWRKICQGGAADFDARYGTQEECKRQIARIGLPSRAGNCGRPFFAPC